MNERKQINLNEADLKALTGLPGVGKSMAERIIAGRPYHEVEQLMRIPRLGRDTLERIRPSVTVGDTIGLAGGEDKPADEGEPDRSDMPSLMERFEFFAQNSIDRFQISSQVVWFVFITGAISILLSVILSLAILVGINRTLNFGRHASVRELGTEIIAIDTALNDLAGDLSSLDQRLQAVEGLTGRMATLEADFELIQEQVIQARETVDHLTVEVSRVAKEVDGMATKVNLFDGFLEGLRVLIADVFQPVEPATSP